MPRQKCTEYTIKWYFNMDEGLCKRGWWGGCRDNGNVFETREECEGECINTVVEPTVDPGKRNESPHIMFISVSKKKFKFSLQF